MKKKIVTTGIMGMAGVGLMTGCSLLMTPEQRAIKTVDDLADVLFAYTSEDEIGDMKSDLKEMYDLMNFEKEIDDENYATFYQELFNGDETAKEYISMLKDVEEEFDFDDGHGGFYDKLEEDDFYVVENPKLYVGGGDFLEIENAHFVYTDKAFETRIEADDEDEMELAVAAIISNEGKIMAYAIIGEEEIELADEIFKDKKGIGYVMKDVEDGALALGMLGLMGEYMNDYSDSEDSFEVNGDGFATEEDEEDELDIYMEEEGDSIYDSENKYLNQDYISETELDYESIGGGDYTARDGSTGLYAFYSPDEYLDYLSIEIETDVSDKTLFIEEAERFMDAIGMSSSQQRKVLQAIEDVQDEDFREETRDIVKQLDEYENFFTYEVFDTDTYSAEITVYGVGTSDEEIDLVLVKYND